MRVPTIAVRKPHGHINRNTTYEIGTDVDIKRDLNDIRTGFRYGFSRGVRTYF